MGKRRVAVIDIGTVTCRLLVADVGSGNLCEVAKGYRITNLGEGVDATGVLKTEAMMRVLHAVDEFLDIVRSCSKEQEVSLRCVATSASRDASNADEFARLLAERGVELSVIPGSREAELSFRGASCGFEGERVLVVDIGGGSTELIAGTAGCAFDMAHSFNVGCRRVTERFLHDDPPSEEQLAQAYEWVSNSFEPFFEKISGKRLAINRVVAVAGTATSVVSISLAMEQYDSSRVHGFVVDRNTVEEVYRRVVSVPEKERRAIIGLEPGRAPVMPAGLVILRAVLDLAGIEGYTASESDILQGVALQIASE